MIHHLQPRSWGGPNTASNKVIICDNAHYSIHALLDMLMRGESLDTVQGRRGEKGLAKRGFKMWLDAGSPPIVGSESMVGEQAASF